jgi:Tc5 transposase DNA-binding domain
VLLDWACHRRSNGNPFSTADLRAEASQICGKEVGINWHRKFVRRHPELRIAKTTRLEPKKEAKNVNEGVVRVIRH